MFGKGSISVYFALLRRDFLVFRKEYPNKFFDTCFLLFTNIIVFAYFMPSMGIREGYGAFLLVGAIASYGFFDIVGKVSDLTGDIEGDRKITYTLCLPLSSNAVFCYIATYWAINSALLAFMLFPIGKLILYNEFDLSNVTIHRLIPMYITIHIFFGFFSLWIASVIKQLGALSAKVNTQQILPILCYSLDFSFCVKKKELLSLI